MHSPALGSNSTRFADVFVDVFCGRKNTLQVIGWRVLTSTAREPGAIEQPPAAPSAIDDAECCQAHLARAGVRVPVFRMGLCSGCFRGKPIATGAAASCAREKPPVHIPEPALNVQPASEPKSPISEAVSDAEARSFRPFTSEFLERRMAEHRAWQEAETERMVKEVIAALNLLPNFT